MRLGRLMREAWRLIDEVFCLVREASSLGGEALSLMDEALSLVREAFCLIDEASSLKRRSDACGHAHPAPLDRVSRSAVSSARMRRGPARRAGDPTDMLI